MISSQERRIWQAVERYHAAEVQEPTPPGPRPPRFGGRGVDDLPAAVVSGIWGSILLVLLGFVPAGLGLGAVTTVAALLWRYWPLLRG